MALVWLPSVVQAQWNKVGGTATAGAGASDIVYSLCAVGPNIYAGGVFKSVYNNATLSAKGIAVWNTGTSTWSALAGTGITGGAARINAIVYNSTTSTLYVGGDFTAVGGVAVSNLAKYVGGVWSSVDGVAGGGVSGGTSLGSAIGGSGGGWDVQALALDASGTLYVGGNFTTVNGTIGYNNIASFNGVSLSNMSGGVYGNITNPSISVSTNATVYAIAVIGGTVYAGGQFTTAGATGGVNNIAQWNGASWSPVGTSIANSGIYSLCVYNNKLYAGGGFTTLGGNGSNSFDWWDGSTWSPAGLGPLNSQSGGPWSMMATNGGIVIAGTIGPAGSGNNYDVEYWDGNKVDSIGSGFVIDSGMNALCIYNNQLYAGGSDMYSGTTLINHIARWNHPLPVGINSITLQNNSISIFPNPSKGLFTIQSALVNINVKVEVYNMLGEVVFTQALRQTQGDHTIDLSNETDGIYLFRILTETGSVISTGKLIIQK